MESSGGNNSQTGRSRGEKNSYRPISLPPAISRMSKKPLLKKIKPIIDVRNLIPPHQFGFREKHSTAQQVHKVANVYEDTIGFRWIRLSLGIFFDVAQAFDKMSA